jgi:Phage integrase family.
LLETLQIRLLQIPQNPRIPNTLSAFHGRLGSVFKKNKPKWFDRTMHNLRGTYVTWLTVMGLTDEQIARIVGWTAKRLSEIRARKG